MADRPDDPLLQSIADSISEGRVVDWPAAGAQTADPGVLEGLRLIDAVARFHDQQADAPATTVSPARVPAPQPASPGMWNGFELRAVIGHGSFGDVYRAFDPKLQQECAVKLLPRKGDASAARSRILAEARMLARVRHANVVAIRGVDEAANPPGLWMELVHGRTLDDLVRAHGPFSAREAASIGLDVCQALAAAHGAGLLHGDVKAHNVMREAGGRIVLMDFGAGRDRSAPPASDTTGTPLYLAPEVFAGQARTATSDVYSLGVLLYFLASGAYPVDADSRTGVLRAHAVGTPVRLRDRRADLPDAFIACVERAIEPEPGKRYQTIGALAAELAQAVGLGSASIALPSTSRPTGPVRIAWLMLAVVVVLAGIAGLTWRPRHASPALTPEHADTAPDAMAPAPGGYRIEAGLFRRGAGGTPERIGPDARVSPGDRLFLEVRASIPLHVYVVNEDDQGESYVLFPLPGHAIANPLAPDTTWRLPGRVGDADTDWQVTSSGGREHFLIVASPERLGAVETMLAALPRPEPGRPVTAAPIASETALQLRGVGGLAPVPSGQATAAAGLGAARATPLAPAAETATGVWVRRLTVLNPK
ncbi:MAG: serine/threonine-protein kinase [Vicinamibacterales bacterium]